MAKRLMVLIVGTLVAVVSVDLSAQEQPPAEPTQGERIEAIGEDYKRVGERMVEVGQQIQRLEEKMEEVQFWANNLAELLSSQNLGGIEMNLVRLLDILQPDNEER